MDICISDFANWVNVILKTWITGQMVLEIKKLSNSVKHSKLRFQLGEKKRLKRFRS